MRQVEKDLEKAESKAELEETQVSDLEEELKIVTRNTKSLEEAEKKAVSREEAQRMKMKQLMEDLKKAEERAQFAEQSVHRVQVEVWRRKKIINKSLMCKFMNHVCTFFQVDKLENEAFLEIDKLKNITDEVENIMFALTGKK